VPETAADAWESWDRRGVPQFRQPHNLFSRSRQILDADLPGINDALLAAGCVTVNPIDWMPPFIEDRTPRPDDDRFLFVTGRRPVVEATFARAAGDQPNLEIRRGVAVTGLRVGTSSIKGVPHVDGVRLASGEELSCDLVIDAMGRRSKLIDWLGDIGTSPPYVESEDSGFVYYTRFFSGPVVPQVVGPVQMPLGTISVLTLFGDNNTWSVTLWASAADTALRGLRHSERFDEVVKACPLQAHWLAGEPITDVLTMAFVLDKYRRFVVDDRPVVTGVVAVGDAWACTNPSAGRGISVGLLHAQRLRDCVRAGLDSPEEFVRRFDAATEADVTPFYRDQIAFDRARVAEMDALRNGTAPPAVEPMSAAFGAALMHDADVFRALLEMVTCLALPQEIFARPGFVERVVKYMGEPATDMPGPSRAQLLELIG
jgi:2-polyprenyl-6-methoxyphenol hydroxylase-like FAD-dependent oxidoreductase